jgi:hypothetical protein
MPGSWVRVPPLLLASQSLPSGWLESVLSGGAHRGTHFADFFVRLRFAHSVSLGGDPLPAVVLVAPGRIAPVHSSDHLHIRMSGPPRASQDTAMPTPRPGEVELDRLRRFGGWRLHIADDVRRENAHLNEIRCETLNCRQVFPFGSRRTRSKAYSSVV